MTKFTKLLTLSLLTLSLVACGKSDDEKKIEKQNDLATEINAMGQPSVSWSDAELNSYEAKLDRLESVERSMGTSLNSDFIYRKRLQLSAVRSAKTEQASVRDTVDKYNSLVYDWRVLANEFDDKVPVEFEQMTSLPASKLAQIVVLTNKMLRNLDARLLILDKHPSAFNDVYTMKSSLRELKGSISTANELSQKYLSEKDQPKTQEKPAA